MGLTVAEVLGAIRLRHPAYDAPTVPTRVLVEAQGRHQRRLAMQGTRRYSGLLSATVPILFDLSSANVPGTVAAGSSGGLPATAGTALELSEGTAGQLVTYDLSAAAEVLAEFVPTGCTSTTTTLAAAGRTVNGDIGLALVIVAGPGSGPDAVREVTSNTATVWTHAAWSTTPVAAQSVIKLVQLPSAQADGDSGGAVTRIAPTQEAAGYLVRLDASGNPYVDLTKPLVATLRSSMTLPPHDRLLGLDIIADPSGGTNGGSFPALWTNGATPVPIYHHANRFMGGRCVWVQGDQMFFNGPQAAWTGIRSLELRFVPIPPLFDGSSRTVVDDVYLLPDTAFDALVALGAADAARFAAAKGNTTVDPDGEFALADAAVNDWLLSLGQRATSFRRTSTRNR